MTSTFGLRCAATAARRERLSYGSAETVEVARLLSNMAFPRNRPAAFGHFAPISAVSADQDHPRADVVSISCRRAHISQFG